MPAPKVDYTQFERNRIEQAVYELIEYLDQNMPSTLDDRYEERTLASGKTRRGKLIITKEDRVKEYYANCDRLAKLTASLQKLKEEAAARGEKIKTRGNKEIPGVMQDDDEEEWKQVDEPEEEIEQPIIKNKKKSSKELLTDPGDFEDFTPSHTQDKPVPQLQEIEEEQHDEGEEWTEYTGLEDDEDDDL